MKTYDVLYFLAELAAYGAVVWFAVTRQVPIPARIGLAAAGVGVFASTWAVFAAPKDPVVPLHGVADLAFRTAWFAAAAFAGTAAFLRVRG